MQIQFFNLGRKRLVKGTMLALSLGVFTLVGAITGTEAQASSISLNTGINTSPGGGGEGAIDGLWSVSYIDPTTSTPITTGTKVVTNPGFPLNYWVADSADSHWVVPTAYSRNNAPPPSGSPMPFTFSTTFTLDANEALNAVLGGRWSSDNQTVLVTLNGTTLSSADLGETAYRHWQSLSTLAGSAGGFVAGENILSFVVYNLPSGSGNPTGFRFEGGVSAVPEPSALAMGMASVALVGGFSWKRRKARPVA